MKPSQIRPARFLHDLATLSRAERAAARAERRAEDALRRERDNPEAAERRFAALEAERHRWTDQGMSPRL
jgi:hypothetical protein